MAQLQWSGCMHAHVDSAHKQNGMHDCGNQYNLQLAKRFAHCSSTKASMPLICFHKCAYCFIFNIGHSCFVLGPVAGSIFHLPMAYTVCLHCANLDSNSGQLKSRSSALKFATGRLP